jgi:chemotaxis signal transduction protein
MDNANKSPEAKESPTGSTSATSRVAYGERDACELFVFEAGGRLFGLPADAVAGTVERAVPAKLPLAPATVLGVICVRGQMLTVLDPAALTGAPSPSRAVLPFVVTLCGDEQLALAAERLRGSSRVSANEIRLNARAENAWGAGAPPVESPILGSVHHESQHILVLDPRKLFGAAMGKSERRRRRT